MIIDWKNHGLSIPVYDYELNVLHFESQRWYQLWNEPLLRLVKQVKSETDVEMEICSENGKALKLSQILYLGAMNQDVIVQRSILKLIYGKMSDVIERNPSLFSTYEEINSLLYQLFQSKNFDDVLKDFELDFSVEHLTLLKLIEMIPLEIEPRVGENWGVHSRNIKETLISLHLEMNPDCQLIVLDYPEYRMSIREKVRFTEFLHQLSVTVLIVTSDYHFMRAVKTPEYLQIVSDLGERYPISEMVQEQQLFYSNESYVLEKTIAQVLGVISFYSSEEQKALESVLKQL